MLDHAPESNELNILSNPFSECMNECTQNAFLKLILTPLLKYIMSFQLQVCDLEDVFMRNNRFLNISSLAHMYIFLNRLENTGGSKYVEDN